MARVPGNDSVTLTTSFTNGLNSSIAILVIIALASYLMRTTGLWVGTLYLREKVTFHVISVLDIS